jgi:hypothetical protein
MNFDKGLLAKGGDQAEHQAAQRQHDGAGQKMRDEVRSCPRGEVTADSRDPGAEKHLPKVHLHDGHHPKDQHHHAKDQHHHAKDQHHHSKDQHHHAKDEHHHAKDQHHHQQDAIPTPPVRPPELNHDAIPTPPVRPPELKKEAPPPVSRDFKSPVVPYSLPNYMTGIGQAPPPTAT